MKVLFLTLLDLEDINERSIYHDLIRTFEKNNHEVFVVCPNERRNKKSTYLIEYDRIKVLKVKTLNLQKSSLVEKGLGTLLLEKQYLKAIKKYFSDIKFDLVLYSTPPITFSGVINFIKQRDQAFTYLLLKDIFPQNAVDLNLIKYKGIIHKFFEKKEKKLYLLSDAIGCMSPANVEYLNRNYPYLNKKLIELNPNSLIPIENGIGTEERLEIRQKYQIPLQAKVLMYGGNLGKPQGLDFLVDVIFSNVSNADVYFFIVGSGTEYDKIAKWFSLHQPKNARLLKSLPKIEYDKLLQVADVGLIFLDPRFTIPNYPSRLLSYLEYKIPVLVATDKNSDIGLIAAENNYGKWCLNGDLETFNMLMNSMVNNPEGLREMGDNGYRFLLENYTSKISYEIIKKHFKN